MTATATQIKMLSQHSTRCQTHTQQDIIITAEKNKPEADSFSHNYSSCHIGDIHKPQQFRSIGLQFCLRRFPFLNGNQEGCLEDRNATKQIQMIIVAPKDAKLTHKNTSSRNLNKYLKYLKSQRADLFSQSQLIALLMICKNSGQLDSNPAQKSFQSLNGKQEGFLDDRSAAR